MYQKKQNVIQRARMRKGLTQEALAEYAGYSDDSIRAWECGARTASLEALGILAECLEAPWLPGVYLREQSDALDALVPDIRVDRPLAEAAADYINCVLALVDGKFDRQLLRMVADGKIDELEHGAFDQLMDLAEQVNRAFFEMKYAKGGTYKNAEAERTDRARGATEGL